MPVSLVRANEVPQPVAVEPPAHQAANDNEVGRAITPILQIDHRCGVALSASATATPPWSCTPAAIALELGLAPKLTLPIGTVEFKIGAGRRSEAAFSLDRQLRNASSRRVADTSLASIGVSGEFLAKRLRIDSDFNWSRSWSRNVGHQPLRTEERSGFSQSHRLALVAVDRPGLRWNFEGALTRTGVDYQTGGLDLGSDLSAGDGTSTRISTRLDLGKWRLRASDADTRTSLTDRGVSRASLGYSGVTLGFQSSAGRIRPHQGFSEVRTDGKRATLDIDFRTLLPPAALSNGGWSAALPDQLTLTLDRKQTTRSAGSRRPWTDIQGAGISGMWSTPLGDTLLDVTRETKSDLAGDIYERSTQVLVSHTKRLGDWMVNFDLLSLDTRADDIADNDRSLFYTVSASRMLPQGGRLKLEVGRDSLSLGTGESEFVLRDKSRRIKIELDLSAPLQKRFHNPSMHLRLEAQMRLSKSDYQIRFLDEVIDSGSDGFARQGVLASFGYRF